MGITSSTLREHNGQLKTLRKKEIENLNRFLNIKNIVVFSYKRNNWPRWLC